MPSPLLSGPAISVSEEMERRHLDDPACPVLAVLVDPEFLHSMGVSTHVSNRLSAMAAVKDELRALLSEPLVRDRLKTAAVSTILIRSTSHPVLEESLP